jgi:hypothetical protein
MKRPAVEHHDQVLAISQSTLWSLNSNPAFAPQVETCIAPDEAVLCVVESERLLPPQPPVESRTATGSSGRSLLTDGSFLKLSLLARRSGNDIVIPKLANTRKGQTCSRADVHLGQKREPF